MYVKLDLKIVNIDLPYPILALYAWLHKAKLVDLALDKVKTS